MNKRTWRAGAVLLSLLILTSLVGVAEDGGVAPMGIIPTPPEVGGLEVRVWVDKGVYEYGEPITVHFSVNEPAYIYIWDILPTGLAQPIYPNATTAPGGNYVPAGEHSISGVIEPPAGTEYVQILATKAPIDPFSFMTSDPEEFLQELQVQVLGILPVAEMAWDFTSFEIVSDSAPAYGALTITSDPMGALVYLNGTYIGYTPRTVYVTSGFHQLYVTKAGYEPQGASVFVIGSVTRTIDFDLDPIGPTNLPPTAAFTFSPANPAVGAWVQFDATSSSDPDGTIVSYAWNFGDGGSGANATAWRQFAAAGTYVVTLTVTDDDGATNSTTRSIQVGPTNLPPTAAFTFSPTAPAIGGWVRFDGTSSTDPDGTIASYAWNFGDGGTSADSVAWHPFSAAGTYVVTLTVTDDDGATNSTTRSIQVGPTNLPPTAAFTFSPANPAIGGWVQFDGTSSSDPDGSIASYAWNFGDGGTSTDSVAWHPFSAAGTYVVTLTVTDDDGATDSTTHTIVVGTANQAPIAAFTYSPSSPDVGVWVRFDGAGSSDPDGTIASYTWSFGDGTMPVTRTGTSYEYHQFTAAGTYTVTLTVTDDDGATNSTTQAVAVGATLLPPVATFTFTPPNPAVGETVQFDASSSYDPDGTIVSYLWDLDGNGVDDMSGPFVQIFYQNSGVATVRLTVVDNDGLSSTTTQPVVVGGTAVVPGAPAMGSTPGIFVWGTDTWHVTVNAGLGWGAPRAYRLAIETDGTFQNVDQDYDAGVAPMGIIPTPPGGGNELLFEGSLQSGSIDYTFTAPGATKIRMSLQMDIDGDGALDESTSFLYLGNYMVHSLWAPFVVGLPEGESELIPGIDYRIGFYSEFFGGYAHFFLMSISELENP